jgi:Tfp pilus assembly protein PilX
MKLIVPIALSLVATLLAVVATRLVVRSRARFDLDDFPGIV